MQSKFHIHIEKHESVLCKLNARFSIVGYVKLVLVLSIALVAYFLFSRAFLLELVILSAVLLTSIVSLWIYHANLNKKITYLKGIIAICKQHIARTTGEWPAFKDTGHEFVDPDHPYSGDLDIVGNKSLFQFLNTTHTWHGRQAFANDLLRPAYEDHQISKRQEAIAELSRDIDFSSKMQYHLSKVGVDSSTPKLVAHLKDKTAFVNNKPLKLALTYVPSIIFLFIAGIFVFQLRHMYLAAALFIITQTVVWAVGMVRANNYLGPVANLPYKLSAYNEVIAILANRDFACDKLKDIQVNLKEAATAIKSLGKIANKANVKHNPLIYFALNALLLWDYYCAISLQEWMKQYAHMAEKWFIAIGEFESLLSFSHLPNVCDNTCLPVITGSKKTIEANELGHPLLPNEKRVNNEFTLKDNILVVSGSNMSGKTTFLRTVGINIVLARAGSFVCAKTMHNFPLHVATSMRLADDLNQGVSTFYAELKRIKSVITMAKQQPNLIFLIDEIFKGTNSADRLTGAKAVIEKLNTLGTAGLISTHDLELCKLAGTHDRIKNFSFSEHYTDNKICFDYKLKQGKSNTTNAQYLMKMVGIFESN